LNGGGRTGDGAATDAPRQPGNCDPLVTNAAVILGADNNPKGTRVFGRPARTRKLLHKIGVGSGPGGDLKWPLAIAKKSQRNAIKMRIRSKAYTVQGDCRKDKAKREVCVPFHDLTRAVGARGHLRTRLHQ